MKITIFIFVSTVNIGLFLEVGPVLVHLLHGVDSSTIDHAGVLNDLYDVGGKIGAHICTLRPLPMPYSSW